MTTYTWTIAQLERNATDGGVIVAHWRVTAQDGEYTASNYGTQSFTPDPSASDFVAYDSLTEATVVGWVQAEMDVEAVQEALQAKIDAEKTPVTLSGTPWAPEASE